MINVRMASDEVRTFKSAWIIEAGRRPSHFKYRGEDNVFPFI